MKGIIKNFRRGRNTQHNSQYVIEIEGISSRAKASTLTGKRVEWVSIGNKKISGKILAAHGNNGAVRAKFVKGLPGQAIGSSVTIAD